MKMKISSLKYLVSFLILLLIIGSFIKSVFTNPVGASIGPLTVEDLINSYIYLYVVTVFTESISFYLIFEVQLGKKYLLVFSVISLSNLITVPIVNVGVRSLRILLFGNLLYRGLLFLLIGIFFLEFLAIGIEYSLLNKLFNYFYNHYKLSHSQEIRGKPLFHYVIFINIVSYGVGSLIFRLIPTYMIITKYVY